MAIHETKKKTDLEKRLKLLRQQVYGLEQSKPVTRSVRTSDVSVLSDLTFLYQDLAKIGLLASLAIGIQLILFFLIRNHILNINFF